jgi:hypothetical protein
MKCSFLIGDRFDGIGRILAEKLVSLGFEARCCSNDPDTILSILEKEYYDGVVYNIIYQKKETADLIRRVKSLYPEIKMFLLSYSRCKYIEAEMYKLGATAFIVMPATVDYISKVIMYNRSDICGQLIIPEIAEFLCNKGFCSEVSGFEYICIAVEECIKSPELLSEMTQQLYPLIAEKCGTMTLLVERMLRHLGELAVKDGVGFRNFSGDYPISNHEMIAAIADEFVETYNIFDEPEE